MSSEQPQSLPSVEHIAISSLHEAVYNQNLNQINLLLSQNADVNLWMIKAKPQ